MVKQIPLTRGMAALVDDADFDELSRFKWHAVPSGNSFAATRGQWDGHRILHVFMHRQIMQAEPDRWVDHKDGNALNNQRDNLRFATRRQNRANSRRNTTKTVPFKGVFFHKRINRYGAQLWRAGKSYWLGYFSDPEEAARAYDAKVREMDGDFACVNFPEKGERAA